jgi:hypothetical protein
MEAILMKPIGLISTTVLLLILGSAVPAYARQEDAKPPKQEQQAKPEKQQEAKPARQEQQAKPEKQQQAKPERRQEAKPARQDQQQQAKGQQAQQQKQQQQQQIKSAKQEPSQQAKSQQAQTKSQNQQQVKQVKSTRQDQQQQAKGQQQQQGQQRAQRTPAEEQTQRAAPALRLTARGEGRIPDDRFRSHFGREHAFRIGSPRMVDGYSRFQYGGYWFGFVEPWPDGWYYTDDVYVDYIDGAYYLYDPYYPGARVSISVVI